MLKLQGDTSAIKERIEKTDSPIFYLSNSVKQFCGALKETYLERVARRKNSRDFNGDTFKSRIINFASTLNKLRGPCLNVVTTGLNFISFAFETIN